MILKFTLLSLTISETFGTAAKRTKSTHSLRFSRVLFLNDTWKTNQNRRRALNLAQDIKHASRKSNGLGRKYRALVGLFGGKQTKYGGKIWRKGMLRGTLRGTFYAVVISVSLLKKLANLIQICSGSFQVSIAF